jgi:hypothetical protein
MIKCEVCKGYIFELGETPDSSQCNCEVLNLHSTIKKLKEERIKLFKELTHADEEICLACKEINPQYENCSPCPERENRLLLLKEITKELKNNNEESII